MNAIITTETTALAVADFAPHAKSELAISDQALSAAFADRNAWRLRFLAEDRTWIAWTGTHWEVNGGQTRAEMYFDEAVAGLLRDSANEPVESRRERMCLRAAALCKAKARSGVLLLAQPKLAVSREAFDRDAEDILNTPAGIVDLRTGAVTPCDPARMLTRCTAVAYDPGAAWPERFAEIVTALADGVEETEDWLWRAIGYTLTGHAYEDAVFFLRGPGGNGKSTLLKALRTILGSYAHALDIKYLTAGTDAGHATEFAALRGMRLVVTSEVERGQKLATSRLKNLTGGDVQAPRELYQSAAAATSWAPSFKLWMFGNHDLSVPANDDGTWRRIHKIESARRFAHSDVRDTLVSAEGAGILAAAVMAAREWYERRLGTQPARVAAATAAYRAAQDSIGRFFAECLEFGEGKAVSKGALTNALTRWLAEGGDDYRPGSKTIAERLRERAGVGEGIVGTGNNRVRAWLGVGLRNPDDGRFVL